MSKAQSAATQPPSAANARTTRPRPAFGSTISETPRNARFGPQYVAQTGSLTGTRTTSNLICRQLGLVNPSRGLKKSSQQRVNRFADQVQSVCRVWKIVNTVDGDQGTYGAMHSSRCAREDVSCAAFLESPSFRLEPLNFVHWVHYVHATTCFHKAGITNKRPTSKCAHMISIIYGISNLLGIKSTPRTRGS
jgi:hypothetical protein